MAQPPRPIPLHEKIAKHFDTIIKERTPEHIQLIAGVIDHVHGLPG